MKLMRVNVVATSDGKEGWVTMKGTQGTEYLTAAKSPSSEQVLKSTPEASAAGTDRPSPPHADLCVLSIPLIAGALGKLAAAQGKDLEDELAELRDYHGI